MEDAVKKLWGKEQISHEEEFPVNNLELNEGIK